MKIIKDSIMFVYSKIFFNFIGLNTCKLQHDYSYPKTQVYPLHNESL